MALRAEKGHHIEGARSAGIRLLRLLLQWVFRLLALVLALALAFASGRRASGLALLKVLEGHALEHNPHLLRDDYMPEHLKVRQNLAPTRLCPP